MTDYMYLCYKIHPTDLINGELFWGYNHDRYYYKGAVL